ncbi:MAG: hypothetical protein LBD75_04425 [Candidatus Peribacteria bacterium]|jgi:hypothetical protein|nr:hypothetical protein [Candidatus Peribacteria bacterium]
MQVENYQFIYSGPLNWEKSLNTAMDGKDFLALYTESGTVNGYKDSFLITEQYNQGKGVLVFSQEAMDTLQTQGLQIEHQQDEKFVIICDKEKISLRLLSYLVSSGFVAQVPKLYMTQLFMEKSPNTILLFSHSTENANEQQYFKQAFTTIRCVK